MKRTADREGKGRERMGRERDSYTVHDPLHRIITCFDGDGKIAEFVHYLLSASLVCLGCRSFDMFDEGVHVRWILGTGRKECWN
jgi:hypothetical protein